MKTFLASSLSLVPRHDLQFLKLNILDKSSLIKLESVSLYLLLTLLITPSKAKNLSILLPRLLVQLKSTISPFEPLSIKSLISGAKSEKGSSNEKLYCLDRHFIM